MANYPYILKAWTLKSFLEKIPDMGIPDKVTQNYLYSVGFKSVNDRPVIRIMKFLKFIDGSGTPTERYKNYRDKSRSAAILGSAIKECYSEVFKVYPDAYSRDNQTLQNFFSTNTGLATRAVKSIAVTFKALCSLAKFDEVESTENQEEDSDDDIPNTKGSHKVNFALSEGRKAQIIMPEDVTEKEIDKLKSLLDAFK